jgi:hypothetical protein
MALKWWAWAAMGGIAYFGIKKLKGGSAPKADIDAMMRKAYEDDEFQRLVRDLADLGVIPDATSKHTGPLQVVLDLKASGVEKMFQSAEGLRPQVLKAARKIATEIPNACPGAPHFALIDPSIARLSETSKGFRIVLVWPAIWSSATKGPVKEQVRICAEKLVRASDKDIRERLIHMTAVRL